MKKIFLFIFSFAVLCTVYTSCGGGNQKQPAEALKPIETEKILSIAEADSVHTLSAEDYTFLLDQYEVVINNAQILRQQGINDYLSVMNTNERVATLNLVQMLSVADRHKLFNDAQLERFDKLRSLVQVD